MNKNDDILENLFYKHPFKPGELSRLVCGSKYCGVELRNGNIGICATLGMHVRNDISIFTSIDFSRIDHRIMVNAWVNACANYSQPVSGNGDIFEITNFSKYKNIVMIGYFGSLSAKFENSGIGLTIFDLDPTDKPVEPIEYQEECLSFADAVILTPTSISNTTFGVLMRSIPVQADVFILGPSTPLDNEMFNYPNVRALFGSRFAPFDANTLNLIEAGYGTKGILPFLNKVYIYKE